MKPTLMRNCRAVPVCKHIHKSPKLGMRIIAQSFEFSIFSAVYQQIIEFRGEGNPLIFPLTFPFSFQILSGLREFAQTENFSLARRHSKSQAYIKTLK